MKNFGFKFTLIIGSILAGLAAMWPPWPPFPSLKLGIDLSGGTILVYEVQRESLPSGVNMSELIAALKQRADPQGVKEIPIRQIGSNRLEIILPQSSTEEVEDVKKMLTDVGSLKFRILASRKHDGKVMDRALAAGALDRPPARYEWAKLGEVSTGTNPEFGSDTITDPKQTWKRDIYAGGEVILTGKDASGAERVVPILVKRNTPNTLTLDQAHGLKSITSYRIEYNPSGIREGDPSVPRPTDPIVRREKVSPGREELYILCNVDRQDVTGKYLSRTFPTTDERLQPAVGFQFNSSGARKFGQLTREHLPEEGDAFQYQLAILLDQLVMSAPALRSEIRDSGIIEGGGQGFKAKEMQHLINILQAGSLPATLNPTPLQEEKVGPTLGEDTIAKGMRAIWISMLVVPIFMIFYYRFAGIVAVLALVANMILLVGSMAFMQATFSLPGLAGLALTIGMAVDANVLVFERMREEKERGASLAAQIRNGFSRAWVTIFDSHVTILLSAVVLYAVGTEEVKGFALTMIIGMLWNLFTAVFMSRVIFEYCFSKGWIRELTMLKMMDKTSFDFVGPRKICMTASVILITLGLIATYARVHNKTLFNIDFTGGSLATIRLNENDPEVKAVSGANRAEFVRQKAEAGDIPDVTVESLHVGGDKTASRFNIRTTDEDLPRVKTRILEAFKTSLDRVEMTSGEPKPIPASDAKAGADAVPDRFAGGREYPLTLNATSLGGAQTPTQVVTTEFIKVLDLAKIANPPSRFEVVPASATAEPGATSTKLLLRTNLEPDIVQAQLKALAASLADNRDLLFERITNVSGTVAGETQVLAYIATFASWIIIIVYLWWRFRSLTYGLAAVLAVVHDVLVTLGAIAFTYWLAKIPGVSSILQIEPFKIDLPTVSAFLTLIGFSVNDTIVIFDRIREIKGKTHLLTNKIVNDALNQTLSRTILTSLTAWIVVVILYLFGGEGLHGFAFALVVGFLSGTYSTIYIATPILVDWIGTDETSTTKTDAPKTGKLAGARS